MKHTMKLKIVLLIVLFILTIPLVQAKDIPFSLDQKEYFFKTGEEAVIKLEALNSYNETIDGLLTYTITQQINQANFQFSSSNTKSTSFSIAEGVSETPISFGTSDKEMTLIVGLKFSYVKDEAREVILEDIKIHFVTDESQKNNQQNQVSSSSKKVHIPQQQPQNTQQKLQNSQLSQDSSAIKQQMQRKIQNHEQMREEFQKLLEKNQDFQKFNEKLQEQGFIQQSMDFSQEQNRTSVRLNYINQNDETASIKAEIVNNTVEEVELVNHNENVERIYWWLILIIALLSVIGYFVYKKFQKKAHKEDIIANKVVDRPFDYKKESLDMLEKAKILFEKKEYKDAYMLAGQSLRLYLSHENGLKKEITNDEIIEHLKNHKKEFRDAKDCFDLCSLVEFAKYQENKKDFDKIVNFISDVVSG